MTERLIKGGVVFGYPVSALRTEARKGRLALIRVAGKDFVSQEAIREMERLCKEQRASDYGLRNELDGQPSITSATDTRKLALAAAQTVSERLRKPSRTISRQGSGRTPANVISLPSPSQRS